MPENIHKNLPRFIAEMLSRILNPIRHALQMAGKPQFGYVLLHEQQQLHELYEAELHHCRRELQRLGETMERKLLERTGELEITVMRYQQAEELARLGHWSYVTDDDRFFCSEEVFTILEIPYSAGGISFNQLKSYINPDDLDVMKQKFGLLINENITYDYTNPVYLSDGRIKYLHVRGILGPTPDENVSGILQDVSLHSMLEMAMQERELELLAACHGDEWLNQAFPAMGNEICASLKTTIKGSGRKILLAEDEPVGREIVTELLERNGHTVKVAEDGKMILDILQLERFDILLSDISMPDMDGTEVTRIIRSGERAGIDPLIPIIALTAHIYPRDRERFIACGINGYIAKPINFDELLGLIESTCLSTTSVSLLANSHFSRMTEEPLGC